MVCIYIVFNVTTYNITSFILENIKEKLEIIRTVYPEWDDINMYTSLLQFSKVEITKYLRLWKEEAVGLDQRSRFHFLAEALEVLIYFPLSSFKIIDIPLLFRLMLLKF